MLVAVPKMHQANLARKLVPYVTQKLVLSVANPLFLDYATKQRTAQALQQLLPHSRVRLLKARAACLHTKPHYGQSLCHLLYRTLYADSGPSATLVTPAKASTRPSAVKAATPYQLPPQLSTLGQEANAMAYGYKARLPSAVASCW